MADGAEFWITYCVRINGVNNTPYSDNFSSSLSGTPETAVFSDSGVVFYDYRGEDYDGEIGSLSFPSSYKYNNEYYQIAAIHCDGSDAIDKTFNVSSGCQIVVYYGEDPENGGNTTPPATPPGGGTGDDDTGGTDGDYAVDSNGNPLKVSLNQFDVVIHYKDLEGNTVLGDTVYNNIFWVRRFDEASYINLEIATEKEETADGARYIITDRVQIQNTIANPPLILQRFDGLISNSGGVLYYEGKNESSGTHYATAYYEVNSFDISIFINDSSRGKVVSTSDTSKEYSSGSTINDVHKNYTLKLTAVPTTPYVFDYWDVNGEKIYNSNLNYNVTTSTTVNCYFKEPIIPEDDRIATNDYINSLFGDENIYVINNDENSPYYELRCPTKGDIKNAGTDKSRPADIIQISNSYESNQCVKEEDISILDKEIKLKFENEDVRDLALSKISIYAAGDDPTKYNSIYEGDIPLIKDWRIEAGSDGGYTQETSFDIPKNLTKVYNKKLKLEIIGYYGANRNLKLFTNTNGSDVDRNAGWYFVISGSMNGTSNVKLYNFEFNTFLNSSINPPIIKIVISK